MALHKQLQKILIEAGLSEVEILIYTELLSSPAQTKWELVSRTNLNRNAVYRACERLENLKMIEKTANGYRASSLKGLLAALKSTDFKLNKTIHQLQKIAPYLHLPNESVEEIQTLFTTDQIVDAYLFMSEQEYSVNHDFGDFENFIASIGGIPMACRFRDNRVKRASNYSICTTSGPNTDYFCRVAQKEKYKLIIDHLNLDYKGQFTIFSDSNNYVMFNNVEDPENQYSVLIKSKLIADNQRKQLDLFSQKIEN